MFLSPAIQRIKPSPTLSLSAQAKALKAQGIDVIDMSVGEPDLPPPAHVCHAAIRAIEDGHHFYTPADGLPSLKKAIIQKFHNDYALDYTSDEIVVSPGAKYVIFQAFLTTVTQGDEVIIPTPGWVSYGDIVLFAGGSVKEIPCPPAQGFKLTPGDLHQAISPHTKWLVLNSPSNPTGAVYTKGELEALAQVLLDFPHVHIMVDDIYEALVYDGAAFYSLATVAPFLKERMLVINGVSKSHSMTGWRIGYGAGPKTLMRAMAMLQSQSTSNPCAVAQKAAEAALLGPQEGLDDNRKRFEKRRDCLLQALAACKGLSCSVPQGAFYLYVNCEGLIGARTPEGSVLNDDGAVAAYFLEYGKVCGVPGQAFGFSPFLRLSYAMEEDILREAARRLCEATQRLSFS